ncbi:MAG: hypothetical protein MUO33_00450 [Sedimentisphaerales bacterium]|nr:hypothetical protein [Sedimentisphaerales bacterium]
MKRTRELMSQPLALVTPIRFSLEKPRAFYSPPEKSYTGISRYHVECNVQNYGSSPSVSIHVCVCLVIPCKEKPKVFHCAAEYIAVLAEKSSLKNFDTFKTSFMFSTDEDGSVINAVRSPHPKDVPVLKICTVYKNLLGASFGCRQTFQIFPKSSDQDTILKNWHSRVSTFAIAFKHEIEQMKRIIDKNEEEWDTFFEKIESDYSSKVEGEDQDLMCVQIPGVFKIEAISEEQYKKVRSGGYYGQFMPEPDHCLIEDQT